MTELLSDRLERRLEALRTDYKAGVEQQEMLQRRLQDLSQTMLRIAGAIQVIEEALVEKPAAAE